MKTTIRISPELELPLDLQTKATAILGIRGSGKTNTGVVTVEELLEAKRQVVVVDPTGVWYGLKSSKDGKKEGYPVVVIGGPESDLPLNEQDGKLIADFVVEHGISVILSLRHLRKNAQRRFVTDFAEQIYHRKGDPAYRTPVLIVIDECDSFIPQRVMGTDARMVGAIEDLVRRGRSAGIGVMLISQRAASINKDVLTQIELMVAHRHTSPQDRKALQEWIQAHDTGDREKEFLSTLASLSQGTAWFWSPGWRDIFAKIQVRERRTFDSSATPEEGEVPTPDKVANVDLEALKEKLSATIEEAKENDPKELKAKIAELEEQLRTGSVQDLANLQAKYDRLELHAQGIEDREDEHIERIQGLEAEVENMRERFSDISGLAHEIRSITAGPLEIDPNNLNHALEGAEAESARKGRQEARRRVDTPEPPSLHVETQTSNGVKETGSGGPFLDPPAPAMAKIEEKVSAEFNQTIGELAVPFRRIINSIAFWESASVKQPTRKQVAFVAGYSVNGHYNKAVAQMMEMGLIEYPSGGKVSLTPKGRTYAAKVEGRLTKTKLIDMVETVLKSDSQKKVFRVLASNPPLNRKALAEMSGYSVNGHFNKIVSDLKSLGIAEFPSGGMVELSTMFAI